MKQFFKLALHLQILITICAFIALSLFYVFTDISLQSILKIYATGSIITFTSFASVYFLEGMYKIKVKI